MGRSKSPTRLGMAAEELEQLRTLPPNHQGMAFPAACKSLLYSLPGARRCIDCDAFSPQWASVSLGIMICLKCSGKHRSYGVKTSFVRSIDMDVWTHSQVLAMLEGGNEQLRRFFDRHELGNDSKLASDRYKTKAALFYRTNLQHHVDSVAAAGIYRGREAVRRPHKAKQKIMSSLVQQQQQQSCCIVTTPKAPSTSTNKAPASASSLGGAVIAA